MAINKWQLKRLWMMPFMRSEAGANLYEWLTAQLLGTQSGMSRKWCYWFREHIVLCRRFGKVDFQGKRIGLFQSGWSLAPVFLSRMATGIGPVVIEDRRRLAPRYVSFAFEEVGRVASKICKSAGADASAVLFLDQIRPLSSPEKLLDACGAEYHVLEARQLEKIPTASLDALFSMGRLEHFSPSDLEALLHQMYRILKPGGVGSHIVDHRDHYWHYDKSIHCFHHLTLSEEQWRVASKGRKAYRNRLLEKDYLPIFERCGFEVLASIHELHREDAKDVDPSTLWGDFANLTKGDLQAAVSHFIVRRT